MRSKKKWGAGGKPSVDLEEVVRDLARREDKMVNEQNSAQPTRDDYLASIASTLERISQKLGCDLNVIQEEPMAQQEEEDTQDLQAAIDRILEKLTENLNDIGSSIAARNIVGRYRADPGSLLVDLDMMIDYIDIAEDEVKKMVGEKDG